VYPFRIFYPDEYEIVPRVIVDVMAALGARGACGLGTPRRVAPTTIASAVKSTISGQKAIRSRNSFKDWLQGPAAAVAPDGGRTGDVRDRMVVTKHSNQRADLEPRTRRRRRSNGSLAARKGRSLRGAVSLGELV